MDAEEQRRNLAGDRAALASLAREFGALVAEVLAPRRSAEAPPDVTTELMQTRVQGSLLTADELTSVLRNWTVGEVGSLAACARSRRASGCRSCGRPPIATNGLSKSPGAPLARLELQVATEELLSRFTFLELASEPAPKKAGYPANGWDILPVRVS